MIQNGRRIALGGITHETNTYATDVLGETVLADFDVLRGAALVETLRSTRTYLGGALAAVDELGAEAVPLLHAYAQPGGTISHAAYAELRDELLARLRAALPVDAVVLEMHGAGVTNELDDLELDLAQSVRAAVGKDVPIVSPLDLHGNLSPELAAAVDVPLGVQLYPHTDMVDRGYEAVRLLPALWSGELRPTTHVERLPLLLPATFTGRHPGSTVNAICADEEADPRVVDCTFFHGFPWTDTSVVGSSVVVTTNADPQLAREISRRVGRWIWEHRADFASEGVPPAEAVRRALSAGRRPVVINETNDNAGGGAPADGTHLLRAIIDARVADCVFGFVVDAQTAAAANAAGVGTELEIELGGKHGEAGGEPIRGRALVRTLTDGRFRIQSEMARGVEVDLGPTARLELQGVDVIVTSGRSQTFDAEIFLLHGIDVGRARIIGLKSQNHFRAGFSDLAAEIVTSDGPGVTTGNPRLLPRRRARALWPLDSNVSYG